MTTDSQLQPIVRVNQLIVAGLVASSLFLCVMLVIMRHSDVIDLSQLEGRTPIVSLGAVAVAMLAMLVRPLLGRPKPVDVTKTVSGIGGAGSSIDDPVVRQIAARWTSGNIARNAVTQAAAIFAGIAYMVEGRAWTLAVMVVLLLWMAASVPTAVQLERRVAECSPSEYSPSSTGASDVENEQSDEVEG